MTEFSRARPTRADHPRWDNHGPLGAGSRFAPPPARDDMVIRSELLAAVEAAPAPIVCVRAPAGYGKTTFLSQWAERDPRPFAWIALDASHDDPVVLGSQLTAAIAAVQPVVTAAQPVTTALHPVLTGREPGYSTVVLPTLGQQLHAATTAFVLVLDDVQWITDPAAARMIALVVDAVPAGSQIVLASRVVPPLSIARLRAENRLLEIGADELALDRREARILLAGNGLAADAVDAVVGAAEGWPVGIYLSGLALRSQGQVDRPAPVTGRERVVVDYLRSELWADFDDSTMSFLTRTSILEELTGPACDAVLQTRGSGQLLQRLRGSNLPVIALDSQDQRFRYHRLLLDALRTEAQRRESDLIPVLHRRASRWFETNQDIESAIRHAKLCGDPVRTQELVWSHLRLALGNGPLGTLRRWLDGISDADLEDSPELATVSAWAALLSADLESMARWLAIATARSAELSGDDPRRDEVAAALDLLRALRGDLGFEGLVEKSADAVARLSPRSHWRPFSCFMMTMGGLLTGREDDVVGRLHDGEALAAGLGVHAVRADCLATLGLLAIDGGRWEDGAALVGRAREVILRNNLAELSTSAYALSVIAAVQARGGDHAGARQTLAMASRLSGELAGLASWFHVLGRSLQASASLYLGEVATARQLIRQARSVLDAGAPSVFLEAVVDRAEQALADLPADPAVGTSALTAAESRVLKYLPTQMSFPEIAGTLFVSRHTIKTQALAIYHKLGVSSRTAAVDRARALGLLPDITTIGRG